MIVFYKPDTGQVMAFYTGGTTSTYWGDRGFEQATVPKDCQADMKRLQRDAQVTVVDGEVTSVMPSTNPEQPQPSPENTRLAELRTKLAGGVLTVSEVSEMLRMERGL